MRNLLAVGFGLGMACGAVAEERLEMEPPSNFELSLSAHTEYLHMVSYVPEGQSGGDWHEILSLQRYADLADEDPKDFLAEATETAMMLCEGGWSQVIAETEQGGFPVAVTVRYCPQPSGTSAGEETILTMAIAGNEALYVAQAAWRGGLEEEPMRRWLDELLNARICTDAEVCGPES